MTSLSICFQLVRRLGQKKTISLADLLNEIETTKNIQDIPDNIVIFPPDNVNDPVTDEDSGEKENVVMYNLPGSQLRAESEFSNYDQQWDSDNEKPLSSFVKRKPKKIKKFSFSKRDLQSILQAWIPVRTVKINSRQHHYSAWFSTIQSLI
nr:unnamed protein product [Callosobruchus chinensis]